MMMCKHRNIYQCNKKQIVVDQHTVHLLDKYNKILFYWYTTQFYTTKIQIVFNGQYS